MLIQQIIFRWNLFGLLLTITTFCNTGNCQEVIEGWNLMFKNDGSRVFLGPDPKNHRDFLKMLIEPQIQQELKLSNIQHAAVIRLRKDSLYLNFSPISRSRDLSESEKQAKLAILFHENKRAIDAAVTEILTPTQISRLTQLAFRIEIALTGYEHSLIFGRLRDEVGIYDGQEAHLGARIKEIVRQKNIRTKELRIRAEQKVFSILSNDQRGKIDAAIGSYIEYRNPTAEQFGLQEIMERFHSKKPNDRASQKNEASAANPTTVNGTLTTPVDPQRLVTILMDIRVQSEIRLQGRQANEIKKILLNTESMRKRLVTEHGNMPQDKSAARLFAAYAQQGVDSIIKLLSDQQKKRLEQISVRSEIEEKGLANALTEGYLSSIIGIGEDEKRAIIDSSRKAMEELERELRKVNENVEAQVMQELSAEQREKLRSAIGGYFEYKVMSRHKMLSERKAAEQENKTGT